MCVLAAGRGWQATVQRKRDSMELLQSSRNSRKDDSQDSSVNKLLREKSSIAASMKSINDVIRYVLVPGTLPCSAIVVLTFSAL
jgi:hypothetical protein